MEKALIITYYWPPAGGPGVQRWLKFAKYLPEFGIEPVVFVPENPTYPIIDQSLVDEVPPGLTVVKHPIFEPYRLAGLLSKKKTDQFSSGIIDDPKEQGTLQKTMLFVRGNFFIPDGRKFWIRPSIRFLKDYLKKERIGTVITTGPPHSVHLIGLGLKKKLDIHWIADFRDPWTSMWYFDKLRLTDQGKRKHEKLENKVLNSADDLIVTTFSTQKEFQSKSSKPVEVITNGFDTEAGVMAPKLDDKFTISHIGSFFEAKNLSVIWEAFAELINENAEFRQLFRLKCVGKVHNDVLAAFSNYGLSENVVLEGYVSHSRAIDFQRNTQILLLQLSNQNTPGIIPGKLFEYLNSRRPILAIGPRGWDVKKIIEDTESGRFFDFSEKGKLKQAVRGYFDAYKRGDLVSSSKNTEKYHRRELTKDLADIIKKAWR